MEKVRVVVATVVEATKAVIAVADVKIERVAAVTLNASQTRTVATSKAEEINAHNALPAKRKRALLSEIKAINKQKNRRQLTSVFSIENNLFIFQDLFENSTMKTHKQTIIYFFEKKYTFFCLYEKIVV